MGRPSKGSDRNQQLHIRVSLKTKQRFEEFFKRNGEPSGGADRISVLLDLAETHRDIQGEGSEAGGQNASSLDAVRSKGHSAKKRRREPRSEAEDDSRASTPVFGGYEFDDSVLDDELRIEKAPLGDLASGEEDENGEVADDRTEMWDEGTARQDDDDEVAEAERGPFEMLMPNGKKVVQAPRLLTSKYYVKFSIDARRRKCVHGGPRTIGQAANWKRMIVERRNLKQLIASVQCPVRGCGEVMEPLTIQFHDIAYASKVTAMCKGARHEFAWATSGTAAHATKEKSWIYVLNTMVPAAILVTGNNYARMHKFAKALNLQWGGPSHHFRVQRGCVILAVEECVEIAQDELHGWLRALNMRVILAGDGQFDSPGSCAKTCTYSVAVAGLEREVDTDQPRNNDDGALIPETLKTVEYLPSGYIIAQAVLDRRHVNNSSPLMEHAAMHAVLRILFDAKVPVDELTTDEHSQVVADFKRVVAAEAEEWSNLLKCRSITRKMEAFYEAINSKFDPVTQEKAGQLLLFYAGIRHSSDIWHKAKNVRKAVTRIATRAPADERDTYQKRAYRLQNHLWFCSETARNDPDEFGHQWLNSIQHVQGIHENCPHGDVVDNPLPDLNPTTPAFKELEAYIRKVAKMSDHLCRFRHTGTMEVFHSSSLAYTAKRHDYDYDTMKMRKQLAALDYNHHLLRPLKVNKTTGLPLYSNKYSKISHGFVPVFLKEPKTYEYIGHLMAAILEKRVSTEYNFSGGSTTYSQQHPRAIQPSVAPHQESPTDTYKQWRSRFPANTLVQFDNSEDGVKEEGEGSSDEDEAGGAGDEDCVGYEDRS